jgi:HD-like signal output (HDOD) protein
LQQALTLIGLDNVRTLVLSVNVFSQFDGNARVAANLPCLWDHSIAVSKLAQQIAAAENCAKALLEECFTAGLLHDLGKLVLLAEFPKQCLEVYAAKSDARADVEKERLGCTHAEVGAYLMSIWGLPFPLVHAVAFHHHPAETAETKFSTLTAVHAADSITSEADPSPLNHDVELDRPYLSRLGLSERESVWRALFKGEPVPSASPR